MEQLVAKLRTVRPAGFSCAGILLFCMEVNAAEPKLEAPSNLIVSQGLQVVLALAVTLATIWGLSRIAMKKSWNRSFKQQRIKVLDSVALGSRERVLLLEVGNQQVLVGSTPGQLRSLHAFEKNAEGSFADTLKKAEGGKLQTVGSDDPEDHEAGSGQALKGQVR